MGTKSDLFRFARVALVLLLTVGLLPACQAKPEIHRWEAASLPPQKPPLKASVTSFYITYVSHTHYPDGSIAGMVQRGLEEVTGNSSDHLRENARSMREHALRMVQGELGEVGLFELAPSPVAPGGVEAALRDTRQNIQTFLETSGLDAAIVLRVTLDHKLDAWLGKLKPVHARIYLHCHVYDRNRKVIFAASLDGIGAEVPKDVLDARDPRSSPAYQELLDELLVRLSAQIRDRIGTPKAPPQVAAAD